MREQFQRLLGNFENSIAQTIFRVKVEEGVRPVMNQPQQVQKTKNKIGRNDPCWCGSGKKFKKCHGK